MTEGILNAPTSPVNSIAPLRNVVLLAELIDRVQRRADGLPGMATFHGYSGFGKSYAAIYAANKARAFHVQVKSVWTRRKLCTSILKEMGVTPAGTISDMVEQIGQELTLSRRPLIIDEADFLVAKGMIEIVRDLYESSFGTIILIGEELLPEKLKPWERVHGRMNDWVAAEPATMADTKHLAKLYARGVELADDLLIAIHEASGASVRRIAVNMDRVREFATLNGLAKVDAAGYPGSFFTGAPPHRRAA